MIDDDDDDFTREDWEDLLADLAQADPQSPIYRALARTFEEDALTEGLRAEAAKIIGEASVHTMCEAEIDASINVSISYDAHKFAIASEHVFQRALQESGPETADHFLVRERRSPGDKSPGIAPA